MPAIAATEDSFMMMEEVMDSSFVADLALVHQAIPGRLAICELSQQLLKFSIASPITAVQIVNR